MSIARIAHRFAAAILDAAPTGAERVSFLDDLADVQTSMRQSRELRQFFESPVIPKQRKLDTVTALFTGRIGAYALSVLRFLVEKEREEYTLQIIDTVFEMHYDREGILSTMIQSAVELSGGQQTALRSALEHMSGKRVQAEYRIDPALMGGLVVRLGDTVYDGSVRRQLKRLHDRFVSGS
jgi:F-type H+-transporting ATPase subunit delta